MAYIVDTEESLEWKYLAYKIKCVSFLTDLIKIGCELLRIHSKITKETSSVWLWYHFDIIFNFEYRLMNFLIV